MKLNILGLETILLNAKEANIVFIEDIGFFRHIVEVILRDENELVLLDDNNKAVKLHTITDYFNFDPLEKNLLKLYQKHILENLNVFYDEKNESINYIDQLCSLLIQSTFDLESNISVSIDQEEILKKIIYSITPRFDIHELYGFERILEFISIIKDFYPNEIFVFTNFLSYLTKEETEILIQEVKAKGITVLFLECFNKEFSYPFFYITKFYDVMGC